MKFPEQSITTINKVPPLPTKSFHRSFQGWLGFSPLRDLILRGLTSRCHHALTFPHTSRVASPRLTAPHRAEPPPPTIEHPATARDACKASMRLCLLLRSKTLTLSQRLFLDFHISQHEYLRACRESCCSATPASSLLVRTRTVSNTPIVKFGV